MSRTRAIIGLVGGGMQILSSAAHSLLGGPALLKELAPFHVGADLERGVTVGWHFGGACMLAFGVIAVATFARRLRGQPASLLPVLVIACTYLAFAAWALAISRFDPFFLVFVVPGALLLVAATGRDAAM